MNLNCTVYIVYIIIYSATLVYKVPHIIHITGIFIILMLYLIKILIY